MPAAASKRLALAEAHISRQQQLQKQNNTEPVSVITECTAKTTKSSAVSNIKSSFPVTKNSSNSNSTKENDIPSSGAKKTKALTPFVAIKNILHRSTAAPQIIGRETEQAAIKQFLETTVEKGHGGSMYISGNPGTGKTACLQALIKQSSASFKSVLVNCVPLTRPGQVYSAILDSMEEAKSASADQALADLEKAVFKSKKAFLVILDEVDSLLGSRQEVLYRLFELAAHPDSRMALVGIANALDLTDRFLPRLQARNCVPVLLNFNPYQVKDIVAILQSRLDSVSQGESEPVIQKAALELCARKVAATSGDLRKALDVCRQAMEAAEMDSKRKTVSKDKENGAEAAQMPKVSIMHIAKVLTKLNGSPIAQKLDALNFQQKLVLCAYMSLAGIAVAAPGPATGTKRQASVSGGLAVSGLYAEYSSICTRLNNMLAPVTRSEFLDLISMMEAQGVVVVEATKSGRRGGRRIVSTTGAADDRIMRLAVDEAEIRRSLTKTAALAPIL
ncbi:AAA ATPase [Coemansia erecta]|uniref:Cell division control protein n=1 Tax=Coemansia asiatica TaxID=1052880 RepID=A0A9W7XRA4_9FUNG|nr:AAA ATPase [Coemansia asiatica]KAJ2855593.1 AAA ATPase [Coemansia erecta]KAJ2885246.1 AAA ATPase [Coemansia asiatica]